MSLLEIAGNIEESCYQRKVRERKQASFYKSEYSIEKHKESVGAVRDLLVNTGVVVDTLNVWDCLFGEGENNTVGLAYLPQRNLDRILEEPMCERGMTLTEVYTTWEVRGYLDFTPYIIYENDIPFLVFDVLGFVAFDGTGFSRYISCDLNMCMSYDKTDVTFVTNAVGENAYLKQHPIGAAILMSSLMTELSNHESGAKAAFEYQDVMFEFVRASTKKYGCSFEFPIEQVYSLYTYTPTRINIFNYALVKKDGDMVIPFTIVDGMVASYSLSDVSCFKIPNFCGVADNAQERNNYLQRNKVIEYMFILSLHMQNIHCRSKDIYAPSVNVRRDIPAIVNKTYDSYESIMEGIVEV